MTTENSIGSDKTMTGDSASGGYTLSVGQTLGQYKIIRPLGRGGMGEVYLCEHAILTTRHAVKLLPAERSASEGFLQRFHDEARVMARLQHPGIVHVTHADEQDRRHYLVMDFIAADGTDEPFDLEDALAAAPGNRLEPAVVARLCKQIAETVGSAHAAGVVHRDLKPANVLLTSADLDIADVRVADFGLARLLGEDWLRSIVDVSMRQSMSIGGDRTLVDKPRAERSTTGSILGTYEYMSPEQREGRDADSRSDVFALGVMLYRMVTGKRLMGMAKPPSRVIKGLDPAWDDLVSACLEEDPKDRLADMAAVEESLGGLNGCETQKRSQEASRFADPPALKKTEETDSRSGDNPLAGRNWTSPTTGMEFLWIDALKRWVGKYEVTNGEYRKKEPWHNSKSYKNYSLNGDRQPVVYVNFDDAKAYADWQTRQDRAVLGGERYRLPSEEEWLTYAQCGDGREYPWGNEWPPPSGQAGNYAGEETVSGRLNKLFGGRISGYNDGFPVTAPVDKLWANPWCLHGVGGNVWEACAKDSTGQAFGTWRGASWYDHTQDALRCSRLPRLRGLGSRRYGDGFRLVLAHP
jgi:serine/threonine protein kinase